jgi:hypothetical protein
MFTERYSRNFLTIIHPHGQLVMVGTLCEIAI